MQKVVEVAFLAVFIPRVKETISLRVEPHYAVNRLKGLCSKILLSYYSLLVEVELYWCFENNEIQQILESALYNIKK